MSSQGSFHSVSIERSRFQEHHSLDTETHHLEREPSSLGHRNTDFFFFLLPLYPHYLLGLLYSLTLYFF